MVAGVDDEAGTPSAFWQLADAGAQPVVPCKQLCYCWDQLQGACTFAGHSQYQGLGAPWERDSRGTAGLETGQDMCTV